MSNSLNEVASLEKAVLNDAEQALTALQDVVEKGATFIPKEVANLSADLVGYIKQSKTKIGQAGGTATS